jgi:hypothetical protein
LGKSGRAFGNGLAAQSGSPAIPTLLDIANTTDSLLAFEVRHGCFGGGEPRLDEVRKTILENRVGSSSAIAESDLVDRLWINLLRLGLFDELLHLIDQHNLPLRSEVKTFIDFAHSNTFLPKDGARFTGPNIRTQTSSQWDAWPGATSTSAPLRYNFRSMHSKTTAGTAWAGQVVFSIITNAAGERPCAATGVRRTADVDVEFTIIPDEMIRTLPAPSRAQFLHFYGMLDHCSIYFAQGACTYS